MIIRSQDKTIITTNLNLWISKEVVGCEIENDDFKLGAYSTEEKAIKVLDMICKAYCRMEDIKCGAVQAQKYDSFCFQMPSDEDVEV